MMFGVTKFAGDGPFMTTPNSSSEIGKASDHLANERTFLAWIRTSISIIVFGFVVAKFGITLRELLLVQGNTVRESGASLMIGLGFMAMGIFMALAAWFRYQSTMRRIETGDFKPAKAIVTVLAVLAALFGIILAVYLIFTARAL
jgi:putative membrane protein